MIVENFYHPLHEIFTYEYGWIPIDRLYLHYKNRRALSVCQLDLDNIKFEYTRDYIIHDSRVRSCTHEHGKEVGSKIHINVVPDCEILVSVDGGQTLEFLTSKEIYKLDREEKVVLFANLETLYDLKENKEVVRMYDKVPRKNFTYNLGRVYGLEVPNKMVVSKYNGRYSILGTQ